MRRWLVACVGAAAALAACSSDAPGFDAPVCALHDPLADVYLVSNRGSTAPTGGGYIARVRPDGSMQRRWIADGQRGAVLRAPAGMALRSDELWVADVDVLRCFDRRSGAVRGTLAIPGATGLGDVAIAPDGTLCCTDTGLDPAGEPTGTDAIWIVGADRAPRPLLQGPELGQPTGLVATERGIYVVNRRDGAFFQVDWRGVRLDLGRAPAAGLGGLARVESGGQQAPVWYATSSAANCIYRFEVSGAMQALPAFLPAPADPGFDAMRRRLLVPLPGTHRLEIVPL